MTSVGVPAIRASSCRIASPEMGLMSIPSFSASARKASSLHIAMKPTCSALARSGGTSGGAANGNAMKKGNSANSIRERAPGSAASSRPVGSPGNSAWRAARPKAISGRNACRFQGSGCPVRTELNPTIELAALHGEKQGRRSGIAAHPIYVEPEHLLRDQGKDEVARRSIVGPECYRHAWAFEIRDGSRRVRRVDEHQIRIVRVRSRGL